MGNAEQNPTAHSHVCLQVNFFAVLFSVCSGGELEECSENSTRLTPKPLAQTSFLSDGNARWSDASDNREHDTTQRVSALYPRLRSAECTTPHSKFHRLIQNTVQKKRGGWEGWLMRSHRDALRYIPPPIFGQPVTFLFSP